MKTTKTETSKAPELKYFLPFYTRDLSHNYGSDRPLPKSAYVPMPLIRAKSKDHAYDLLNRGDGHPFGAETVQRMIREEMIHTSMSVGDVLKEKDGPFWICLPTGWESFAAWPAETHAAAFFGHEGQWGVYPVSAVTERGTVPAEAVVSWWATLEQAQSAIGLVSKGVR